MDLPQIESIGQKWNLINKKDSLVEITAVIRNNLTGEIREHSDSLHIYDQELGPYYYTWEDGNYCCDCNRRMFFRDDLDENDEFNLEACSEHLYSVKLINPVTGKIFYQEF
jgi:hypothetical protein